MRPRLALTAPSAAPSCARQTPNPCAAALSEAAQPHCSRIIALTCARRLLPGPRAVPTAVAPAAVPAAKKPTSILGAKKPAAKTGGGLGAKKLATPVDDALFDQRPREAAPPKQTLAGAAASSAAASKAASPAGPGPSERFAYSGPTGDDGKPRVTHHDAPPMSGMDFFEASPDILPHSCHAARLLSCMRPCVRALV